MICAFSYDDVQGKDRLETFYLNIIDGMNRSIYTSWFLFSIHGDIILIFSMALSWVLLKGLHHKWM